MAPKFMSEWSESVARVWLLGYAPVPCAATAGHAKENSLYIEQLPRSHVAPQATSSMVTCRVDCTSGSHQEIVTIVTPVYNAADVIQATFKSVMQQTFSNWSWVFINDASTDNSLEILERFAESERRVHVISMHDNVGAAESRNRGVLEAKGRYIAFLDADDLWHTDKLRRQVEFMQNTGAAFSFTSYEFANDLGEPDGRSVRAPDSVTYRQALTNSPIWTSTVMFDMQKLSKEDVRMPDVRRGQDTATWWKVLKRIDRARGLDEVLAYYRARKGSLSSNPFLSLHRTWLLYRNVEKFSISRSAWYYIQFVTNSVRRRLP